MRYKWGIVPISQNNWWRIFTAYGYGAYKFLISSGARYNTGTAPCGSGMCTFDCIISGGWGFKVNTNSILNAQMNGYYAVQKVRCVRLGNGVSYLDLYTDGRGLYGHTLGITVIYSCNASVWHAFDLGEELKIGNVPSGYTVDEVNLVV